MKVAQYNTRGGGTLTVEYDENAPCRFCGKPLGEASMGGTDVCPWCDIGENRDGAPIFIKPVTVCKQTKFIRLPNQCPVCSFEGISLEVKLDGRIFIICKVCQQTFEKSVSELILESELDEQIGSQKE